MRNNSEVMGGVTYDPVATREVLMDLFRKQIRKRGWSNAYVTKGQGFVLERHSKNGFVERKYQKFGWFYRYLFGESADKSLARKINRMLKI